MKRLTLAELKEQSSANVTTNLESVKGGVTGDCHCQKCEEVADAAGAIIDFVLWLTPFHR